MKLSYVLCSLPIILNALSWKGSAQTLDIKHVEPMHWWTGMKNSHLQLLIHGDKIKSCTASIAKTETGLTLKKTIRTNSENYLFLDLEVAANAKPGIYHIRLTDGKRTKTIDYSLKLKASMAKGAAGYGPEDVLYLIMPDRFANGDPSNDNPEGALEKMAREQPYGRHGGDLAGIDKNLDYFKNLGVTTLWINPILENNQPYSSYHGYSFTDLYKVDPRFGSLDEYKKLIQKCHQNGLKMVQDMVANHIGSKHWWMEDMPTSDWVHPVGDPFNRSNFRIETVPDPNRAKSDQDKMLDGWFDVHMPDLNQRNPLLATYLIQNSLWWIAETGIDGIRMDTYPYNDKDYMTRWCDDILKEFPKFSLVGEVWVDQPSLESYFTKGAKNQDGYKAGLPTVTDFPLYFAITKGLQEKSSWDNGLQKVYTVLSQDFLYKDPSKHLVFVDNHDLSRFITTQKGDDKKFRQGIAMALTLRGVPQLYYGGEIGMAGDAVAHSNVRHDFPGGWAGDSLNLFVEQNRKGHVDSVFRFHQNLLQWRKTSEAIAKGKFTHYLPDSNVYTYFRTTELQTVMVVVNGSDKPKALNAKRFKELEGKNDPFKEVISGQSMHLSDNKLRIPANGVWVLEHRRRP